MIARTHNGTRWEYVNLAINDHFWSPSATIELDERGTSTCWMLRYERGTGVIVSRSDIGARTKFQPWLQAAHQSPSDALNNVSVLHSQEA